MEREDYFQTWDQKKQSTLLLQRESADRDDSLKLKPPKWGPASREEKKKGLPCIGEQKKKNCNEKYLRSRKKRRRRVLHKEKRGRKTRERRGKKTKEEGKLRGKEKNYSYQKTIKSFLR